MDEDLRIDSHKLLFHPERVSNWLKGKNIYPICAEISPSGSCNHRCIFCGLDYLGYKSVMLNKYLILKNLKIMIENGLKSVVVCGEGEPLLNNNTPSIINAIKQYGSDVAMSTNGVLFTNEVSNECLGSLTWIRFSLNAGCDESHLKIHRGKPEDFSKVIKNISDSVRLKKDKKLLTTIGVQMLLIPENFNEVFELAKKLKSIGVDYFTIKPFSKHPNCNYEMNSDFNYNSFLDMEKQLKELSNKEFSIIFRSDSMNRTKRLKRYERCQGLPFWIYIDADAEVWACIAYIGNTDFSYGNLKENSFPH